MGKKEQKLFGSALYLLNLQSQTNQYVSSIEHSTVFIHSILNQIKKTPIDLDLK